jgi:XTP/dITP diphosphohydrolase
MDKTIYIATKNQHKVKEIKPILKNLNVNLKSLSEIVEIPDAIEDGQSFRENALKKARHYFKYINQPVIADDSGLVVPALGGEPGIYSARYSGDKSNYALNNQKLLRKMEHLKSNNRNAYFICVVAYKDKNQELIAEGRCHGRIVFAEKGKAGFGYDPVFEYPELGKTFAEIEPEIKNTISHRYNAFVNLTKKLNDYSRNIDKQK